MGLNTKQDRTKSQGNAFNLTRSIKFKFQPLNDNQCRMFEAAQGLEMYKCSAVIRVNNGVQIGNDDRIRLFGKTLIVISVADSYDNFSELKYADSLDMLSGTKLIGLE